MDRNRGKLLKNALFVLGCVIFIFACGMLRACVCRGCAAKKPGSLPEPGSPTAWASSPNSIPPIPSATPSSAAPRYGVVETPGMKLILPPGPVRQADVPEDLQRSISQGIEMLKDDKLEVEKCGGRGKGAARCSGDYILAAISPDGSIGLIDLYEKKPSDPPGFTITSELPKKRAVGANVPFVISAPPGWTVLALRTVIPMAERKNGKRTVVATMAVNVPYTSRIDEPILRRAGMQYLADTVSAAAQDLRTRGVMSNYTKDKAVPDAVDLRHVVTLILTEQRYDANIFAKSDDAKRLWMLNRSLVSLGANREGAFRYGRSSKKAVGIGQIIPKTYRALDAKYPNAGLTEDPGDGRLDHLLAVKAAILHADDELATLRNLGLVDEAVSYDLGQVLAAGYNSYIGNSVVQALRKCHAAWAADSCKPLLPETRLYLVKYRWTRSILFDAEFNTGVADYYAKRPY